MTIASAVHPAEWVPECHRKPIFIADYHEISIFAASSAPNPIGSHR